MADIPLSSGGSIYENNARSSILGPDHLEPREVSLPEIGAEEALIEVEACGFCGSDISIVAGSHPRAKAPLTLGHELSGRIVQLNSSSSTLSAGDLVTIYPLISCGRCYACTHGNPHVCRCLRLFGFDVDGGMAQFVKVPVSSLVRRCRPSRRADMSLPDSWKAGRFHDLWSKQKFESHGRNIELNLDHAQSVLLTDGR